MDVAHVNVNVRSVLHSHARLAQPVKIPLVIIVRKPHQSLSDHHRHHSESHVFFPPPFPELLFFFSLSSLNA